ncbi:MAG: sugar kinase [Actinomycetota bacterium]|nr:sugar kinase [Actinomycetota bacterium]
MEFDIVSIGECMVEFYSDRSFQDTELFFKSYGGDTLNVLAAATRLGSRTGCITRIGEDHFAPFLLQNMLRERINLSMVKVIPQRKNGIYFISEFEGDGLDLAYYRDNSAAATISVDDLETEYISAARYLYVSGIGQAISNSSRGAVLEACRLVKVNKTGMVSYSPHYNANLWSEEEARKAFQEVLPYIDILFFEHPYDAMIITGVTSPDELIKDLWQQGIRVIALYSPQKECIVGERHSGMIGAVGAYSPEQVVGSFGSKEAFIGAFLHGLSRGFDVFEAARLGNITAGLKMAGRGSIASLPVSEDVYKIFGAA